jgi:hypothetical protein
MKLKKRHFGRQPDKKIDGKKLDPVKVLKKAYDKPTKVAEVGGRGFV